MSVTSIVGARPGPPNGSGIVPAPAPSFAVNCQAPAGALGQLPLVAVQVLQESVAPLGRGRGPDHLQAAGDGVLAHAGAEGALPAQTLLFDGGGLRLGTDRSPSPAPWVLPKLWPPTISAAVSSSFIAIRPNVSRISTAAADWIRLALRGLPDSRRSGPSLSHRRARRGPGCPSSACWCPATSSSSPKKISSGSQMSSRPKPKPKVLNPIESTHSCPRR